MKMNQISTKNDELATAQQDLVMKYLTFLLGDKSYAISILKIKEIIEYGVVTPIPRMPEFICGAINLRGSVVPVIDLQERLGKGKSDITNRSCIVIIEMQFSSETLNIGVIVDAVSRVMDLKASEIERAPSFGGAIETDFIEGMGKVNEEFVVILNVDRVLSLDNLNILSKSNLESSSSPD
jgi:purine-binding chemotaxis protein CheW